MQISAVSRQRSGCLCSSLLKLRCLYVLCGCSSYNLHYFMQPRALQDFPACRCARFAKSHGQILDALYATQTPPPEPGWAVWVLMVPEIKTSLEYWYLVGKPSVLRGSWTGWALVSFLSMSVLLLGTSPFLKGLNHSYYLLRRLLSVLKAVHEVRGDFLSGSITTCVP